MNRFFIFLCFFLSNLASSAQTVQQHIMAKAGQACYVVGEHLKLTVNVCLPDSTPSPSHVAYVEIADTDQLYTQAMLTLDSGCG